MTQVNIGRKPRLSLSDRLTRSSAVGMITFYQRYISPHKGFRCAHRVHHGGQSCSAYAKTAVQNHGLGAAIPLIRQRFSDCSQAARVMKSQALQSELGQPPEKNDKRHQQDQFNCWTDLGTCDCPDICLPDACLPEPLVDCSLSEGCDIGGCDGCGDMDLGGCDACDVGGCDF